LRPPPEAAEPDDALAEAIRRDAELESGQATPLTEEEFWGGRDLPKKTIETWIARDEAAMAAFRRNVSPS
jgi:hypothetical protein